RAPQRKRDSRHQELARRTSSSSTNEIRRYWFSSNHQEDLMFSRWRLGGCVLLIALASPTPSPRAMQRDAGVTGSIAVRTTAVDGVKLQYLTAGRGPAIVLLHGYAETSRMWRPLIPRLATNFTVIAPDLPGIGDSDIPKDGLDMAHAASRVPGLVSGVGIQKASLVGHDIGLMVAYAYAAQFPLEVEKLVLMDA